VETRANEPNPARSAVDHASHALENRRNKANSARSAVEMTRTRFGISQNEANLHITFTISGDKYMVAAPVASRKRDRRNEVGHVGVDETKGFQVWTDVP
jgi:hypothetical protein